MFESQGKEVKAPTLDKPQVNSRTASTRGDLVPELPLQMRRLCTHALCGKAIDVKRTVKGSSFCSNECKAADKKARRLYRANRHCRTCGRVAIKREIEPIPEEPSLSVAPGAQRMTEPE